MTAQELRQRKLDGKTRWRRNNLDKSAAASRRYRLNHPDRIASIKRKQEYGMSEEEFNYRKVQQDNRCAICKVIFIKTPHVDHDHVSGKNRDLLCSSCNLILGHAHDQIRVLEAAISYLKRHENGKET